MWSPSSTTLEARICLPFFRTILSAHIGKAASAITINNRGTILARILILNCVRMTCILRWRIAPAAAALFGHAEFDYTFRMRVRQLVLLVFLFWVVPVICKANDASPRAILNSLNALRLDAQNV